MNKQVLIVYNYIAHYRIPIFALLSKSTSPNYTIASGTKTDIDIKIMDENSARLSVEDGGVNWIKLNNIWIFNLFLIQLKVLKLSVSSKYDSIIFLGNMYYLTTWIGAILGRLTGKKIIFWTHGYIRQEDNIQGFVRKIFYKLADEILVYGQRAKDILISKGFDSNKVNLIYNSLDFDSQLKIINDAKNEYINNFSDESIPVVGFIGRLTKQKKVNLLLEVISKLKNKNILCNLLIIGGGEQLEYLENIAKELGISENVCFYGPCYDELMIYKMMKNMRVLVSPGEVGLTAIHSMTYGVPVISHDRFDKQMPEYEVIVPGLTGDFFDYSNASISLQEILETWMSKESILVNRKACFEIIKKKYNPFVQLEIFNKTI